MHDNEWYGLTGHGYLPQRVVSVAAAKSAEYTIISCFDIDDDVGSWLGTQHGTRCIHADDDDDSLHRYFCLVCSLFVTTEFVSLSQQ